MKLGEKDFSTFLQHCTQLEKHIAATYNDNIARDYFKAASYLPEVLGDIDKSCNAIFGIYGQRIMLTPAAQSIEDVDHASVSVVNALILKVFQLCDRLLSCDELKSQGLVELLFQKRLEFNLMQARIVMSKIGELTQGGYLTSREIIMIASQLDDKLKKVKQGASR